MFVYNWGMLAYEGGFGKVGIALSFYVRVLLSRECIVFLFYLGGISFGYVYGNWGFVFVCLLMGGGVSSVLPNFQGLEVGSYSHHRVFGGDQSLDTCNSRIKLWGGWFVPG